MWHLNTDDCFFLIEVTAWATVTVSSFYFRRWCNILFSLPLFYEVISEILLIQVWLFVASKINNIITIKRYKDFYLRFGFDSNNSVKLTPFLQTVIKNIIIRDMVIFYTRPCHHILEYTSTCISYLWPK
jgi:hypothetical protein